MNQVSAVRAVLGVHYLPKWKRLNRFEKLIEMSTEYRLYGLLILENLPFRFLGICSCSCTLYRHLVCGTYRIQIKVRHIRSRGFLMSRMLWLRWLRHSVSWWAKVHRWIMTCFLPVQVCTTDAQYNLTLPCIHLWQRDKRLHIGIHSWKDQSVLIEKRQIVSIDWFYDAADKWSDTLHDGYALFFPHTNGPYNRVDIDVKEGRRSHSAPGWSYQLIRSHAVPDLS